VPIPVPDLSEPTTVIEESFTLPQGANPGRLAVRTLYKAGAADRMRDTLESSSPAERARKYLNFYAQDFPAVRALHPPSVEDARDADTLSVSEEYELPDFWSRGRRQLHAWPIGEKLELPETSLRTSPLEVQHPIHIVYRLRFEPGLAASDLLPDTEVKDETFRFSRHTESTPTSVVITYDYRSLQDFVAATGVRKHLESVEAARTRLRYDVARDSMVGPAGAVPAAAGEDREAQLLVAGLAAIFGAVVTYSAFSRWRQGRQQAAFARTRSFSSGAAPETAIPISDPSEREAILSSRRCPCGSAVADPGHAAKLRYDARTLTVITRVCGGCGQTQFLYFST
jgi:hypothetical protein